MDVERSSGPASAGRRGHAGGKIITRPPAPRSTRDLSGAPWPRLDHMARNPMPATDLQIAVARLAESGTREADGGERGISGEATTGGGAS